MNNEFKSTYANILASVELTDKAISFVEGQLCTASLDGDNPDAFNNLLNDSIRKLSVLDPSSVNVFSSAARELKYINELVSKFPITITALYSAILLEKVNGVLLRGPDCALEDDIASIEVEDSLQVGEQMVVLSVDKRTMYFSDMLATLSTVIECTGWESTDAFYSKVGELMVQTRAFLFMDADNLVKATTSPENIELYKASGARLDASQLVAMFMIDVLRRFGCDLAYDRSVDNFKLSQSAYNAYALLLDSYLRNLIDNAQLICNAVKATV